MGKSSAAGFVVIVLSALIGLVVVGPPWDDEAPPELRLGANAAQPSTTVTEQPADQPAAEQPPTSEGTDTTATPGEVPPYPGQPLKSGAKGPKVKQWQEQMRSRGWDIATDGQYGSQATTICRAFQRQKGLDPTGIVDEATWVATWTAPVPDNTDVDD